MKKIVTEKVLTKLLELLPRPEQKKTGRPKCSQKALLGGILYVLKYDIPWNNLPFEIVSGTSCWRYFREIQRRGIFKQIQESIVKEKLEIKISSIDTTVATSYNFKNLVGFNGKHKKYGTKISVLSDVNGLPYDIEFGKGNKHDLTFVSKHIDNTKKREKKIINMDKGYTSIKLRRELSGKKIKANMEVRKNDYHHKKGPKFKLDEPIYKLRFVNRRITIVS